MDTENCKSYNPDKIFNRFKVVEFPMSFVGLSSSLNLDVEIDLNVSAYLKTLHNGQLMKFEEARNVSASHRAFEIILVDNRIIQITFKPTNECISRAKLNRYFDNRFVFDLRLIKADGTHCCNKEFHSEVGRYYIAGQFEYCTVTHFPKIVNFGDVVINKKVWKYIYIKNESCNMAAQMEYESVIPGYIVEPYKFVIKPKSTRKIKIRVKPTCLKVSTILNFTIRNPHELKENKDCNFISYKIHTQIQVTYNKKPKEILVESLHKLFEQNPNYTYIGDEIRENRLKKKIAWEFLQKSKSFQNREKRLKTCIGNIEKDCCHSEVTLQENKTAKYFCKNFRKKISVYDLFDVLILPLSINFGRVGLSTYGEEYITIFNSTRFDITMKFLEDQSILYSEEKFTTFIIKLKPFHNVKIKLFCLAFVEGSYHGTFPYSIDDKFYKGHPYQLQVGNPTLMIKEKYLRFGMVATETFITSVPIRIHNNFNVAVNFKCEEFPPDTPFQFFPASGSVPKHSCRICDVIYSCKPTKTKTHEVDFISQSKTVKIIPIEISILTRKLAIKFLQPTITFKDVPLNLETKQRIKLENSSREITTFYVVEPLIPGFRVEPMSGIIRPKTIITFTITVHISCIMEFAFDLHVKINNKENVVVPITGNVVEPKLVIHPKNIFMPRIPSHMITYVPVVIQNLSSVKSLVVIKDTGDENIFEIFLDQGKEKQKVAEFFLEGGQMKTFYVKVYDIYRREYEFYLPFQINGLLGPPTQATSTTDLHYYTKEFEKQYENNLKVKVKSVNKDISYCRIVGVITIPWIQFSIETFEMDYIPGGDNVLAFTMTNVSKNSIPVTIMTSKLAPNFTLSVHTEDNQLMINETQIKFDLNQGIEANLFLKFHPRWHGKFISNALLYLDKLMTVPYSNLTFIGKRQTPAMVPSTYRIIFPPCHVECELKRLISIKAETVLQLDSFYCGSKEEKHITVMFLETEVTRDNEGYNTNLSVEISVHSETTHSRNVTLNFHNENGAGCDIEVSFCFTDCPITLHAASYVEPSVNPYPFFPTEEQSNLYKYMKHSLSFIEKWMFQQGFRRDFFPSIPDTFHAISSAISSPSGGKSKGINVSYLNFLRRIAGPLMKQIHKITPTGVDESFQSLKEIHDTYDEIITLLKSRSCNLWVLQARFLLSYDQFVMYTENVTPKCNADILFNQELLSNEEMFNRLSKQSWMDLILQSYKAFILSSCFFDCVCVNLHHRDTVKILLEWYNLQIKDQHATLREKQKQIKIIENITTDLSDGIAIISAILNHCTFLKEHFVIFSELEDSFNEESCIINNACLIIEALNLLKVYFPLSSKDFVKPNFLQMLFLSVHLYVSLPMFKPRDIVKFNPPLLRSSSRLLAVFPASQEALIFNFCIFNNPRNSFAVEKAPSGENGKKMFLSVRYLANFVSKETSVLLIYGYNKTRIFDTYMTFLLEGTIGCLNPIRKCKVTGPLYRPNKVDVLLSSPFQTSATFQMMITDIEPTVPVVFQDDLKPRFYLRRLNLVENEITLAGLPKETGQDLVEQKLYLQIICLSTQVGNTWIWFRSEIGEFFIRVTTQPRWDLAIDTLQGKVHCWPLDPCSCGESCECYRTTVVMLSHKNEIMIKSLRYALAEFASETMMQVFDILIENLTGRIVLGMLLAEGGTNISDVAHILRNENAYRITSRVLQPRLDRVTLEQHSNAMLALPITIPPEDRSERYTITFTSECGMDIRTYRVIFIETMGE